MKLTFGSIKNVVAKCLNMNSSDPRVLEYTNRAIERLIYDAGKSVDTLIRYTVCIRDGCLVWPREIETIEAWEQCGCAGTVRNGFYEFLGYGPGGMSASGGSSDQLIDRGNAVAFDDVVGTGKKLAFWADGVEDAGLKVLVRYYDGNANKVYTNIESSVVTLGDSSDSSVESMILAAQQIYFDRAPTPPNNPSLPAISFDATGSIQQWIPTSQSWV